MQYCVLLSWISFRVTDPSLMWLAMEKFVFFDFDLNLSQIGLGALSFFSTLLTLAAFGGLHLVSANVGRLDEWLGRASLPAALLISFLLGFLFFFLWPLEDAPFIYFQF
jgi:hypothetical protein